jgi:hypothetical protein
MTPTEEHLKRIQDKLQQLLKKHAVLQKENLHLREELGVAKKDLLRYSETADNLKQQLDVLKFTNADMNDAEKKEFEKRINVYVKEIDRCITLLSE